MLRKTVFILLLFTCGRGALAQQSEAALGRIHYEFVHVNDTLERDKVHREEFVLYLGQGAHLYGSYASQRMQQQVRKQMEDPAFDGNLTLRGGRSTAESYYTNLSSRQFMQLYSLAGQQYIVEDAYPEIGWEIGEETREIGGYLAQQATGHFAGRDYTAWFTTELPFAGGPWKLLGLPGLVLEAYDSRREVEFRYAGFEKPEVGETLLQLPENAVETDKKSLDKLIEAYKKNPQAAMSARSRGSSGGGSMFGGSNSDLDASRIKSINVFRDSETTSPTTNNPLELN